MNWLFSGLIAEMRRLSASIRSLAMSNRQPLLFVFLLKQEANMALVYTVTAGKPGAADVVSRELSVVVNGVALGEPVSFAGDVTSLGEVKVEQGAEVTLSLVDIDDATPQNRSQPAVVTFVAVDTIAPPKPGEFGVTLAREE
jgi:hypothetical protein